MRQDKIENDAKKIVREKTEQTKRSDAWGKNPEKPGGFRDLIEDMGVIWRTPDSKKG